MDKPASSKAPTFFSSPQEDQAEGLSRMQAVDVELNIINALQANERELVPKVHAMLTSKGDIVVESVVECLKQKGYAMENCLISYYSPDQEMFVCSSVVPYHEYEAIQRVVLKIKVEGKSETTLKKNKKGARTRTKERKIGDVIEKVCLWRKLYTGFTAPSGEFLQLSLCDAAEKVGIAKKSLDDYLLQLRYGKKYGFDFDLNKEERFGFLRNFVKIKKDEEKVKGTGAEMPTLVSAVSTGTTTSQRSICGP